MWFKKKSVLQGEGNYNSNTAYDGTDWRTANNDQSWTASSTLPSAANAGNYFYLPALGYYRQGLLKYVGNRGLYWSSSASLRNSDAYGVGFYSGYVGIGYSGRHFGFIVEPTFE